MTKEELQKVRDWADEKITTGAEPPWSWFQYMKLREVVDQIIAGKAATFTATLPEDLQLEGQHPESGHLRLVGKNPPDTSQPDPDAPEIPLPM